MYCESILPMAETFQSSITTSSQLTRFVPQWHSQFSANESDECNSRVETFFFERECRDQVSLQRYCFFASLQGRIIHAVSNSRQAKVTSPSRKKQRTTAYHRNPGKIRTYMIGGFLGIFARGYGASDVPGQDHFCQKLPGILLCALIAK